MNPIDFIITRPKDALLSTCIKPFIQTKLKPYGTMTSLNIDSVAKSIDITLDLKGEPAPVEIHVRNYQLVETHGNTSIRIGEIETSREWINRLLQAYLPEEQKTIPLPPAIARAASILL